MFDELPETIKLKTKVLENYYSINVDGFEVEGTLGMSPEEFFKSGINIEAVPIYNLPTAGQDYQHVKGRGIGYVLTADETWVDIAGDTEDTEEMRALVGVDIAFIPMNLPYTMSVKQATAGVLAFSLRLCIRIIIANKMV